MVEQVKTKSEPHVRFRGFTDEWEQCRVDDLFTISAGGDISSNSVSPIKTDVYKYPVVANSMIDDGLYGYTDSYKKDTPSLTVTGRGDVGYAIPRFYKYYPIVRLLCLTPKESNVDVYFSALAINRLNIFLESTGVPQLTAPQLSGYKLYHPLFDEQQKIGELFQTLDSAIDLSNTQVENLKQQKKALLQRLFPQKGETEPNVRLRGFTDEWEEVELGDVFSVYSKKGRTDLPFVTVGERETNERTASAQGYGNDVSDKARAKAKVLLSGQFLIDLSSYGRGIYMSRMDGVTSSAYNVLNLDNGADSYWVEYLISHDFVESLKRLTPPGARQGKMIEVDGLLKTKTFVPSLEEQQAIGELFQTLDEQIRLAEDKVSQYKELKQALLQRLFV